MENLKENAKIVDITKEMLPRLAKKYAEAVAKVEDDGKEYIITFAEGYSAFGQKTRKAKNIPGVMWYSKVATEEKADGKLDMEKWSTYFKENNVVWDGKNIPEYILTKEQIEKANTKKAEKTEKTENK